VHDLVRVRAAERPRDLDRVGERLVDRQPPEPPDAVLERLPSTYSKTMYGRFSSSPASMTPTMCGWLSCATARASRLKRSS